MICKYVAIILFFSSGITCQTTSAPIASTAAPVAAATVAQDVSTAAAAVVSTAAPVVSAAPQIASTVPPIATSPTVNPRTENVAKRGNINSSSKDWTYYSKTGKFYKVFSGFMVDYNEAELICETYLGKLTPRNTSLVTISSWEEQKFVYSLALMSMNNKVAGEGFWVGATHRYGETYKWTDANPSNVKDEQNFFNLFDPFKCDSCGYKPYRCGFLDLSRGPLVIIVPSNRWKFIDCIFKNGFICQTNKISE